MNLIKQAGKGMIYIIATPIGNRLDITQRAIDTLASVDFILAEDTRHSNNLLRHYGISKPLKSLHQYNELQQLESVFAKLSAGQSCAIISDAGTPLVSDPGYLIVNAAHERGITVSPIPGACAAVVALSVVGLPTDCFSFHGFLPAKSAARLSSLRQLAEYTSTMVFYEAPHRILATLADMQTIFGGGRSAAIARELTKKFETVKRASIEDLLIWVEQDEMQQRGEFVIIVAGCELEGKKEAHADLNDLLSILLNELPLKQAVKIAMQISGEKKNIVYRQALALAENVTRDSHL